MIQISFLLHIHSIFPLPYHYYIYNLPFPLLFQMFMACRINFPIQSSPIISPIISTKTTRAAIRLHSLSFSKAGISSLSPSSLATSNGIGNRTSYSFAINAQTTAEKNPASEQPLLVFVPPHPLIKHWVSVLRNEQTPSPIFKNAMGELGRLLIYEASRDWLPTVTGEIQTPLGVASVEFIDPREPVVIVPILRAGLALVEHASSILPATKTYHLGLVRNEETLLPTIYLNKLPKKLPEGSRVLVVDPMLATGGTIVAAIELLSGLGVANKQIKVIAAVAAPPALQKLSEKFPGLQVYTGTIDPTVNEKGFIVPGLGDAGDRSYGT